MSSKHKPIRTCIVTREKLPKSKLIRIVRNENGEPEIDAKGKKKGRGANIKMDLYLFQKALEKGILKRALKLKKDISEKRKQKLIDEFSKVLEQKEFRKGKKNIKIRVTKEDLEKAGIKNKKN